jgi:hypothetical protein
VGLFGGVLAFAFSFVVCLVIAALLIPLLPWLVPGLMLAFSGCAVGILLSFVITLVMRALYASGVGITRLAALVFAGLVPFVTLLAWFPVLAWVFAEGFLLGLSGIAVGASLMVLGLIVVLVTQLVLTGFAYAAAATAYSTTGPSPLEGEARGACAGVSAAVNVLLTVGVILPYLAFVLPPVLNVVACAVAFILVLAGCLVPFLRDPSNNGIVPGWARTLIGWLVFMLPTAWLMELLGLFLFLLTLLVHGTIGLFVPMLTMTGMGLRADTGSIIVTGGIAANLNPAPTHNIGTFTFVRTITPPLIPIYNDASFVGFEASVQNHEIGHQLNLGAFGTAFNLVGFVEQWGRTLLLGSPAGTYGEDLATTNDPSATPRFRTPLNMWVI